MNESSEAGGSRNSGEHDDHLEMYVLKHGSTYEKLPATVQRMLGFSKVQWEAYVLKYSLHHQMRWRTSLIRDYFLDERTYYEELVRTSRLSFMLYPYHLLDILVRGLRITPFDYYHGMMVEVMKKEKSYDSLPNFTAADIVRLLNIGRNEYIDIMNSVRTKGWIWKKKINTIKKLLPSRCVFSDIPQWWEVCASYIKEEDLKSLRQDERQTILVLVDMGPSLAGIFDRSSIISLYQNGLIYLNIPLDGTDIVSLPSLEGFVMNRVQGDYLENLLYKVFVSMDERTTIDQLAEVLQIDVKYVKMAVSMYLRLGFARKRGAGTVSSVGDETIAWHPSWLPTISSAPPSLKMENENNSKLDRVISPVISETLSPSLQALSPSLQALNIDVAPESERRIGFIFDSTLTAFLMMGNLAPGLKTHAVTLFEVGKLPDENMDDFLSELEKVDDVAEGEAQRYADHAIALRRTIQFLRRNEKCFVSGTDGGVDLLRCERLNSLDESTRQRLLSKSYSLLISMTPISAESRPVITISPSHFGPSISEVNSCWFSLFVYREISKGVPSILFVKGSRINSIPKMFGNCKTVRFIIWESESLSIEMCGFIPVLNEKLKISPVMVQAETFFEFEMTETPVLLDIAFPIENLTLDSEVNNLQLNIPSEEAIDIFRTIKKFSKRLNLDCICGFIRFMKIPFSSIENEKSNFEWCPHSVNFGIPLFDKDLATSVCDCIFSNHLFTSENLKRHSIASRELSLHLLSFLDECLPETNSVLSQVDDFKNMIPYPARQVEFDGHNLSMKYENDNDNDNNNEVK